MKSTRLILLGIVTLALAVAMWLYIGSEPTGVVPSHERLTDGTIADEPPRRSAADAGRTAAETPGLVRPMREVTVAPAGGGSLESALALPNQFDRRHAFERLGFDAGANASAALQTLAGIAEPADRAAFIRGMFTKLAGGSSSDALAVLTTLRKGHDRDAALAALVETWRPKPIDSATAAGLSRRYGGVGSMVARLLDDPLLAVEYGQELLTGQDRARLMSAAAFLHAAKDPTRALSFGAGLEGEERAEFLREFAGGWARAAGASAWEWARQESDPALRESLRAEILAGWSAKDPAAAALRLPEIQSAESRQNALQVIGTNWAESDTQAAFAWASTLTDAEDRAFAEGAIRASAPVGIGVVLASSEEGFPLVREVVPGSPAGAGGLLKNGTQIAAVGDGRGGFRETQGKALNEVVEMIRGKPGTSVVLQVIPPGAPSAARATIVVPRQQLMFKKPPGA